jgi:hypothetical protein
MALLSTLVPLPPARLLGRRGLALLMLFLTAFSVAPASHGQSPVIQEYVVKAVFLFNFAQFVEWPAEAVGDAHGPLVIGILGKDPFGARLDETVSGETVNGRPLEVRRFGSVDEALECHIL